MTKWELCLQKLKDELSPQQINMWILPLQAEEKGPDTILFAPNKFVRDKVFDQYLQRIQDIFEEIGRPELASVHLRVGTRPVVNAKIDDIVKPGERAVATNTAATRVTRGNLRSGLNPKFNFDSFVEGKSNQLARAASIQVGNHAGTAYNPLFIYGGVGLGKTHLMHAVGNKIIEKDPEAKVVYMHSERFVTEMVKALQHNKIDDFKRTYRTVNALLIDDVQFFAGKERSQEEFFHTFNALFESQQQIVLSSDRFPKEVKGLEERLRSRFGWGLTVAIDPPDLETRVAILQTKAVQLNSELPSDVAFFVGKRIRSNIRELEGALRRLIANAHFTGKKISMEFAKEALRDMFAAQDKMISLDNIQKEVADYYQLRVSDLLSAKRSRSIARPRQVAMTLAKELTSKSLPEIGSAFGGRDHTTVIHANKKIKELKESDARMAEDYSNLLRILSS